MQACFGSKGPDPLRHSAPRHVASTMQKSRNNTWLTAANDRAVKDAKAQDQIRPRLIFKACCFGRSTCYNACMKKASFYLFSFLLILGVTPLLVALAGIGLSSALGCDFIGAEMQNCMVMGADLGPVLTTMIMMHWLGLVGLPLAALGALGLIITGVIHLITRKRA